MAKVEEIHFDAILHDSHDEDQIHLKPLEFPMPMFGLAVEPAHKGQEQKLAQSLMPPGLLEALPEREVLELLKFLTSKS